MLVVNTHLRIPLRELRFTFARSSGPGGQNVNKVNSKAVLRWAILDSPSLSDDLRRRFLARYARRVTAEGELVMASDRFRDAGRNVADCLEKLRRMLAQVATPPKRRRPTRPTRSSLRRRIEQKRRESLKKQQRRELGEA